jgi:hypothetical protein
MDGRVVNMAVMVVCGVNEQGHRDIIACKISSTNMLRTAEQGHLPQNQRSWNLPKFRFLSTAGHFLEFQ